MCGPKYTPRCHYRTDSTGKLVYANCEYAPRYQGYGFATLPDQPTTPETLWYAGSTTKAFTAAVLARFIDSGTYSELADGWSTTISSIIRDDFVMSEEWATNHLTLEDAVCHRTGLPSHQMTCLREMDGRPVVAKDVVRNLRHLPVNAEPRVRFQYGNLMYVTLSHVIETLTGKPLAKVFQEEIWEPLGMESSYLDLEQALQSSNPLARGYY